MPSLEIITPIVMSCALLWWIGRDMTWNARLIVAVVTLAVIVGLVFAERADLLPDRLGR